MSLQETLNGGFRFLLFPDDAISATVLAGNLWEPHCLELTTRFVNPGDTVLDAGANFGFHTLHLSRQVGPRGKVYAFEPQRIIFQQLCFHLFLNQASNVWAYPNALGDVYGQSLISELHEAERRNIGATPIGEGSNRIDILPPDHFQLERFSFIKIDIQGCEERFLKGGTKILQNNRPLLFIEIEENWLRRLGSSSKQLIETLFNLDYALVRIETDWPTDHFCIPKEKKDQALETLANFPWKTTLIEGRQIELEFAEGPFYRSYRILK